MGWSGQQDPNLKTGLKLDDLAPGVTTSMVHLKGASMEVSSAVVNPAFSGIVGEN